MSHIRTATCKIKNPDQGTMNATMQVLAKQYGGVVTTSIKDYYGNNIEVIAGLSSLNYGLIIKDGALAMTGDGFGKRVKVDMFREVFEKTYIQIAMMTVMKSLGYQVNANESDLGVLIQGIKA